MPRSTRMLQGGKRMALCSSDHRSYRVCRARVCWSQDGQVNPSKSVHFSQKKTKSMFQEPHQHCDNLTMGQRWKPSANPGVATPSWVMWPSTIQPNLRAMLDLCVDLPCCAFAKAKSMPVSAEPQCPNWCSKRYPAKPRHIESEVHACLSNALGWPMNFGN